MISPLSEPISHNSFSNKNDRSPSDTQDMSALLVQIQKGKVLKKTITNDRSAPIIKKVVAHELSNRVASTAPNSSKSTSNHSEPLSFPPRLPELFQNGVPKLKHREGGVNTGAIHTQNAIDSKNMKSPPNGRPNSVQTPLLRNNSTSSRSVSDSQKTTCKKTSSTILTRPICVPPPIPRTISMSAPKKTDTQGFSIPPLAPPPPPPPPPPPVSSSMAVNRTNMRPPPPPPPPPSHLSSSMAANTAKEASFYRSSSVLSSQGSLSRQNKPYVSLNFNKLYTGPGIKPSNINIMIDDSRWKFKNEDEFPAPRTFSGEQKIFKSGRQGGSTVPLILD